MMRKAKASLAAALAWILLFSCTACGRTPAVDTADDMSQSTESGGETGTGMPMENGGSGGQTDTQDNSGNGQNNNENTPSGGGQNGDAIPEEPVDSVSSAADAVRFISHNVYSLCSDVLPMAVETRALDLSDTDAVQYNTGLTATDGITDIVLSESAVGSFAYSLVYVRTDGKNTDAIHQSLKDSIDPRKWVCVEAEAVNTIRLDDDICVVMGSAEQVDTISASLRQAAEGVFEQVGDFTAVL